MKRLLGICVAGLAIAGSFLLPGAAQAARTESQWAERLGSYLETAWPEGRDILINGENKYLNFGDISGSTGYGFRDLAGVLQWKDDGGSWAPFGSGGGGTPGGADTYVQFNSNGAFAGDSHFTFSSSTDTLHVHAIGGDATDGLILEAANGTDVGILGAANTTNATWYGAHNFGGRVANLRTALGTTPADGFYLENSTAAAAGAQQISPSLRFSGRGWSTGGAGSSQAIDARTYLLPVQGASGAHGTLKTQFSRNGAAFYDVFTQSSTGEAVINVQSGVSATTGLEINGPFGNSTPGTTRLLRLNSTSGYANVEFTHSGTLRQAIINNSSGGMELYASGGNYFGFNSGNAGLTSNTLFAYLYPTAFVHNSGYGAFNGGVYAGGTSNPGSTLRSSGSFATKVVEKTTDFTADAEATTYICDPSTATCTGTPSAACSSHANSTACALYDAHGGCTWFAGNACSAFNNEGGMSTCGSTSGCSVDTSACSGAGDQSSCEAQDDAYGGACSWDAGSNTCPSYTDTSSCNAASPCYANVSGDCGGLSDGGGDGTNCATQPECSYDSGSGTCSGSYFTSCDGDNTSPSCNGNYNTGGCSGSYGAECQGTSSCGGIDDSTSCGSETGCTWATAITATLPAITAATDRVYTFYNSDSGNNDVVLVPTGSDQVNHTTSYTLSSYKDFATVQPLRVTSSCNDFTSAGACTPTGCSVNNQFCSYDTGSNLCTGNAVCPAHDGNQSNCEAQSYFSSCDGTYVVSSNWYVVGR